MNRIDATGEIDLGLELYARMHRIRAFEELCLKLSTQKDPKILGSVHLCAGQEAVPVGVASVLKPEDRIVATYRGHGWALEAGIDEEALIAEICHKANGINGGRAGSAMIMAPQHRFIGENSIVGAGAPIACGVALAALQQQTGGITVVSFGDGATSQGALHEALVFAAAKRLPVMFICENNGWSEMTPISLIVSFDRLAQRARGYGINGITIDGTDPFAVRSTAALAAEALRAGEGPVFIECKVPRLWGHYNRDMEHYRTEDDRNAAATRDPITKLHDHLITERGVSETRLAEVADEVIGRIRAFEHKIKGWAEPEPSSLMTIGSRMGHVTAGQEKAPASKKEFTYIQAVNDALRAEMKDRNTILFGEDVGYAGGIFAASRYLQREYGEDRVFDTPIAESAILGAAVGAAAAGMKPIVEIMWADFMLVALDQLINQAANYRFITGQPLPMVVRTQQGCTPGSCAQHSQNLEALLAQIPGLKVGLPSTPQDAYSMLRAAANDEDPCIIIESRALYPTRSSVNLDQLTDEVGQAAVRREGGDVALIGWGPIMPKICAAAEFLKDKGVEAHVLDLRWLSPIDDAALDKAVAACSGRVIIAHEANITGGFGAEILARLYARNASLKCARVGLSDMRIPASPTLSSAVLPNATTIADAAMRLLV